MFLATVAYESKTALVEVGVGDLYVKNGADFYKVSQVINGGPNYSGIPNGWTDRENSYNIAKKIF